MDSAVTTEEAQVALAALTEEEHDIVLDQAVTGCRDLPGSFVMYDDSKQPPKHVLRRMQDYDPQVFARWNRLLHRWEIWRWKGGTAEIPRRRVRPDDIGTRAVHCYVVRNPDRSYRPLGEYMWDWLRIGDPWRKWHHDMKECIKRFDEEAISEDDEDERDISTTANDWAHDNKRQIAEFFGHSSPIFVMGGKS